MKPALCILAAGLGSRLENYSEHINKALLPLDNKAIISHLIDKTPSEYDVIVVLGYKGQMVNEYCLAAHPNRNFTFVEVDKYKGEGSGPGYSIKQAKKHLQRPFIWVTADTVITDKLPPVEYNWLGLYPTSIPELYSTAKVKDGLITDFTDKSKDGYQNAFIGLAGVYDYSTFWDSVRDDEIVGAYYDISKYSEVKEHQFDWYDVGTVDNYIKSQRIFKDSVTYSIPKTNGEFLYKVEDNFIKLCSDKDFISGRVKRSAELDGLVPPLNFTGDNLYSYKWKDGKTLYDCDIDILAEFLYFCSQKMWKPLGSEIDCTNFYKDKTLSRLDLFLSNRNDSYKKSHIVNGVETEGIDNLISNFDWNSIINGNPTKIFHGDLQFDNVVYGNDRNFYLLDWRQDFNGGDVGDVYYDLAKMYGGILMSYKLMKKDKNFTCFIDNNLVNYDYNKDDKLIKFRKVYEQWLFDNGYDLLKIKRITSLIFLNMAPLHEKKFGDMLFFKSKKMLQNDK